MFCGVAPHDILQPERTLTLKVKHIYKRLYQNYLFHKLFISFNTSFTLPLFTFYIKLVLGVSLTTANCR